MSEIELQLPALHNKTAAEDLKKEFLERRALYTRKRWNNGDNKQWYNDVE